MNTKLLKQRILDLAISGKLVEQNPADEPASELLKRIRKEKEAMVKAGKLKKKDLDSKPIAAEEIPFEVPESWEWCRLGEVATIKGGKRIPKGMSFSEIKTNHIYIRVTNMKNNTIIYNELKYIDNEVYNVIKNYIINSTDLYLTIAGTIGEVGEVPIEFNGMNLTENAARLTNIICNKKFLLFSLLSSHAQEHFSVRFHQVAQPKLSIETAESTPIPLPPLAEQERIVAKVEELLHWVDVLEENETALNAAAETAKKRILDLAISGKLVEQNPADEPASELLKRIRKEKELKIKNKELKLSKPEKSFKISIDNDFQLPETWTWCNLYDVCRPFGRIGFRGYTKDDLVERKEDGAIAISPSNIIDGKMDFSFCSYLSKEKYEESPEIIVNEGDILLVKTASCGKTALIDYLPWIATINPQISVLKEINICKKYLLFVLLSNYSQSKIQSFTIGTAVPTFSTEVMLRMNIPLPPLAEQERIVAKVEELFGILEKLQKF